MKGKKHLEVSLKHLFQNGNVPTSTDGPFSDDTEEILSLPLSPVKDSNFVLEGFWSILHAVGHTMTNTSVVLGSHGVVPDDDENRTYHGYTVNNNNDSAEPSKPQEYNWPVLCLFSIVVMALCGNILVCISVRMEKKLQNMFNFFLVSLAMSDMLSATLVMPLSIIKALINGRYIQVFRSFFLLCIATKTRGCTPAKQIATREQYERSRTIIFREPQHGFMRIVHSERILATFQSVSRLRLAFANPSGCKSTEQTRV